MKCEKTGKVPASSRPRVAVSSSFFWVDLALAVALTTLVVLAPVLDTAEAQPQGWPRLIAVFARDSTLRQTAGACALGLVVTAWVFFRAPVAVKTAVTKTPRSPTPTNVVGA